IFMADGSSRAAHRFSPRYFGRPLYIAGFALTFLPCSRNMPRHHFLTRDDEMRFNELKRKHKKSLKSGPADVRA
ncbi:hypothetical protein, partial [Aeromonas enteropelogenes]|uniref:hypothetical protein n=1 Tax=Aeromonas enteropelogenes TaxID=29489 RepID=UPI001C88402A